MDLILTEKQALDALCRRYRVATLDVFGSAVCDDFDPERSDLDFLVTFQEMDVLEVGECYFGLKKGLEELYGRPVDLVMLSAVKNPYFYAVMQETRTPLYAAA